MSCIFSPIMKKSSNIEVLDYTHPETEYDYLRPRGTITIEMDNKWNLPIVHFDFDGWSQNSVRLWPDNSIQREKILIWKEHPCLLLPKVLVILAMIQVMIPYFREKMMRPYQFDNLSVVELLQNIHDYLFVLNRESYLY